MFHKIPLWPLLTTIGNTMGLKYPVFRTFAHERLPLLRNYGKRTYRLIHARAPRNYGKRTYRLIHARARRGEVHSFLRYDFQA
jgi:hypothetical protein